MKKILSVILCLFIITNIFSFGQKDNDKEILLLSAAASLINVMTECIGEFEKRFPDIMIRVNYAASGILQQQIAQGAPVDIFFPAGQPHMNILIEKNHIQKNSVQSFITNHLVIVGLQKDFTPNDLTFLTNKTIQSIAVGEFKTVPLGQYTKEVFDNQNIYKIIESKLIFAKDAREVLTWVETANVDAGIVYKTDALASKKVHILAHINPQLHSPINYPIGIAKNSKHQQSARSFIDFLSSPESIAIFEKHGFIIRQP
ncbi:MAG: molybdate ABC transporter substrate-binding protein [Treponemataceae bacterium]